MKAITAVLIGAGNRGGRIYAKYALAHPDKLKLVAVVESDEIRRKRLAEEHNIPLGRQFAELDDFFSYQKMADAVMVCTQDRLHYQPVMASLAKGYHVLCEKPMSCNQLEIIAMGRQAKKYKRCLTICHVLRYSAFFMKIKALVEAGTLGKLVSMQYIEEVGFWHYAHSFVRGNWRNSAKSSPMILQKACHDMDIILWLMAANCRRVSSYGELSFFNEENKPQGAPKRCLEDCPYQKECLYYAPKLYLERQEYKTKHLVNAISNDVDEQSLLKALKDGPYGRCVFQCDNDVVDHQVVNLEFDGQTSVSFVMSAFTEMCGRRINLMGTRGQLKGEFDLGSQDYGKLELENFQTGERQFIDLNDFSTEILGMDELLMESFVKEVGSEGKYHSKTGVDVSIDSHLLALAAEESRREGQSIDFMEYKSKFYQQCKNLDS